MPTAWPDVRLVASFVPSSVDGSGASVAAACVDIDLDDGDALTSVAAEVVWRLTVVVATTLVEEGVAVTMYETGWAGKVIVPERVGFAADFLPEQILYSDSLSCLDTVVHS